MNLQNIDLPVVIAGGHVNLEKSVSSRLPTQLPGSDSAMKKALITSEVIENCSCIFYSPSLHGPLYHSGFTFFHYAIQTSGQINKYTSFSRPTD